jgi:hypothetical protein
LSLARRLPRLRRPVRQRLAHRDCRQHDDAAALGGHQQGFRGRAPVLLMLLGWGQTCNVFAGVAQGSELAAGGKRNRIIETVDQRFADACGRFGPPGAVSAAELM